jgi:hypothetical protein
MRATATDQEPLGQIGGAVCLKVTGRVVKRRLVTGMDF